jgi:hypothetical protein
VGKNNLQLDSGQLNPGLCMAWKCLRILLRVEKLWEQDGAGHGFIITLEINSI